MRESLLRYQDDLIERGNPWDLWAEKVDEARKLFAKIINADLGRFRLTFLFHPHLEHFSALSLIMTGWKL
ncbi:hypothetical protein B2A_05250 [mine drainage metagenome]|uniref:Uncharacterized protein n=1 Tax=mine drainage metagenome TaxID=410659 RepID=T1BTB8_9ZZZZ